MTASSHRSFSSLSPTVQALVIRLIQEELQTLTQVPSTVTGKEWDQAIRAVDPTLLCYYADGFIIQICPESRALLLQHIQQELMATM